MPRNPIVVPHHLHRILQAEIQSPPSSSSSSSTSNHSSRSSGSDSSSSSSDLTRSLIIIVIIFFGVFITSATLHFLIRFITRFCKSSSSSSSSHNHEEQQQEEAIDNNNVVAVAPNRISSRRVVPEENRKLIDSLPLFSFDSITGLKSEAASADCAVCLSRFEKQDQLRLLPICCHAFHSQCIDTWLSSNNTCPLCRSTIVVAESEQYLKLFSTNSTATSDSTRTTNDSFRIEIGSVSRRRNPNSSESGGGDDDLMRNHHHHHPRSYSMGTFDYFVDEESAVVVVEPMHRRGVSECVLGGGKKEDDSSESMETDDRPVTPGPELAGEVAGSRGNWLRDYVDKLGRSSSSASSTFSSRGRSFRFSGRFFAGSGRQSEGFSSSGRRSVDVVAGDGSWDLEGNRYGEEISNFFRWLSGV